MKINDLNLSTDFTNKNTKLNNSYNQLQKLIQLLNQRELPEGLVSQINSEVSEINNSALNENSLRNLLRKKQSKIITLVEKELKIVPINYYRNLWLAVGMSAFGLPIGVAIGLSLGNMGLLGLGLPIGIALGVIVGTSLDKKAKDNGKQLDIELK